MEQDRIWYLISRKVAGEATPGELSELEQLLRQHPQAQFAMELMTGLWDKKTARETDSTEAEAAFDAQWRRLQKEKAPPATIIRKRPVALVFAIAAMLVVVLSVTWRWASRSPHHGNTANNEVSTRNGSRSKITLPDGTQVWLNSGSKLTYSDEMKRRPRREVYLTGEAYFEVAPDAGHPFIIHAGHMQVNVLGTTFNVYAYPDTHTLETTLVSGSIEVLLGGPEGSKVRLQPKEKLILYNNKARQTNASGEVLRYSIAAVQPLKAKDTLLLAETSWVQNRLVFNNERLEDLAIKMERWFNVRFTFNSEQVKTFHYTGSFENESIEGALHALQLIHPFRYTVDKDRVTIY